MTAMNIFGRTTEYLGVGLLAAFGTFHAALKLSGHDITDVLGPDSRKYDIFNHYYIGYAVIVIILIHSFRQNARQTKPIGIVNLLALLFVPSMVVAAWYVTLHTYLPGFPSV
jgi:hypothetical protein